MKNSNNCFKLMIETCIKLLLRNMKMKNTASDNLKTREKILSAAVDVFVKHGFNNTTIREICQEAGVNVAAVNYHFGGKDNLYVAVCKHVLGLSGNVELRGFDIDQTAPPEEQLRLFIRSLLFAILDHKKPSHEGRIMAWEMVHPTGSLDTIIKDMIRPRHEQLCAIVGALLGPGADVPLIKSTVFSIVGQCIHYRHGRPVITQLHPKQKYDPDAIEKLAEHITRFSLGGIKALAREIEE